MRPWIRASLSIFLLAGVPMSFLCAPISNAGAPTEGMKQLFRAFSSSAIKLVTIPKGVQATGFLTRVSQDPDYVVLVTNNHVFTGNSTVVAIIPICDSAGRILDTVATPVSLTLKSGEIAYARPTDTSIDLAAIAISKEQIASKNKGYWSSYSEEFFAKPTQLLVGQPVWFFGYPLGLTSNRFEPILRSGVIAAIDTVANVIRLDADAFGGSSGSPVFLNIYDQFNQTGPDMSPIRVMIGVIQRYEPFIKTLVNPITGMPEMIQTENSGIADVIPTTEISRLARLAIARITGLN